MVIREDLNVPMKEGRITNDKRIRAALPTIGMALDKGAGVIVLSHLGRPTDGSTRNSSHSSPWPRLGELLGRDVPLVRDPAEAKATPGQCVLLETCVFSRARKRTILLWPRSWRAWATFM